MSNYRTLYLLTDIVFIQVFKCVQVFIYLITMIKIFQKLLCLGSMVTILTFMNWTYKIAALHHHKCLRSSTISGFCLFGDTHGSA